MPPPQTSGATFKEVPVVSQHNDHVLSMLFLRARLHCNVATRLGAADKTIVGLCGVAQRFAARWTGNAGEPLCGTWPSPWAAIIHHLRYFFNKAMHEPDALELPEARDLYYSSILLCVGSCAS